MTPPAPTEAARQAAAALSLAELRTARDVLKVLAAAEPDPTWGSLLWNAAVRVGGQVREREAALMAQEQRRQWALQTRADLRRKGRG